MGGFPQPQTWVEGWVEDLGGSWPLGPGVFAIFGLSQSCFRFLVSCMSAPLVVGNAIEKVPDAIAEDVGAATPLQCRYYVQGIQFVAGDASPNRVSASGRLRLHRWFLCHWARPESVVSGLDLGRASLQSRTAVLLRHWFSRLIINQKLDDV